MQRIGKEHGQSKAIERKESWNDDCLKALAALANSKGGTLLIGVDDGHVGGWNGDGKEQEMGVMPSMRSTLLCNALALCLGGPLSAWKFQALKEQYRASMVY